MDANLGLTFVTLWQMVSCQMVKSWKNSDNKKQCGIRTSYDSHEVSMRNTQGGIPSYTLK